MSQKIILALLLCLSSLTMSAQELVPYLCADGKYGISDDKGKVIIPCEYDEVEFNARDSFFMVRKGGKYGVIRYPSCKTILPPVLETSHFYVSTVNCEKIENNKTIRLSKLNVIKDKDYTFIFDVKDEDKASFYAMNNNKYKTGKFKKNYLTAHTIKYIHDLWKFKQKDGLVNFYHKDGYILLKKDVINGAVISADRLLIEGKNGKLALANLKGKTLTSHTYERIEITPNEQFIVNSTKGLYPEPEWAEKVKVGVLSNDGKLVIDTAYRDITTVHGNWYAVMKKREGEDKWKYDRGVLDANGNTVLSINYEYITTASNNYVVAKKWDSDIYQIINLHSPEKAVFEGKDIQFQPTENVYKITDADKKVTILGADLKEIYSGTFNGIRKGSGEGAYYINTGKNKFIFIKKGQKNKEIEGIGKAYRNEYSGGYRYVALVVADTLHGLLDENYNVVFEPIYAAIRKEKTDQLYFLVKKNKTDLFEIHDSIGQKLDIPAVPDPFFLRKDYSFMRTRINREEKLLFRDGSIRDVLGYEVTRPTKSANGKYLYASKSTSGKRYYILNEDLYNIIPKGYWIPKKYLNEKQLEIGLICVYNDLNCGVIDAEGNWVVPASYNNYVVHDAQTIIRHYDRTEGVELLLKKGNNWEATKYQGLQPIRNRNLFRVSKRKEGTAKEVFYGLVDSLGNVILPLQYDNIQVGKKYISAVIENKADSTGVSYIYDESMYLLFETRYSTWIEENKDYITLRNFKTNKSGIVNFENETIVSVKYNSLKYYPKSNLIQYTTGSRKDKTLKYYIADSSGKAIYTSKTFYPRFIDVGDSTQLLLMVDRKMIIFDANNEVIGEYDLLFKQKTKGMHHFITCETKDTKKLVYVNMLTGKIMMD